MVTGEEKKNNKKLQFQKEVTADIWGKKVKIRDMGIEKCNYKMRGGVLAKRTAYRQKKLSKFNVPPTRMSVIN